MANPPNLPNPSGPDPLAKAKSQSHSRYFWISLALHIVVLLAIGAWQLSQTSQAQAKPTRPETPRTASAQRIEKISSHLSEMRKDQLKRDLEKLQAKREQLEQVAAKQDRSFNKFEKDRRAHAVDRALEAQKRALDEQDKTLKSLKSNKAANSASENPSEDKSLNQATLHQLDEQQTRASEAQNQARDRLKIAPHQDQLEQAAQAQENARNAQHSANAARAQLSKAIKPLDQLKGKLKNQADDVDRQQKQVDQARKKRDRVKGQLDHAKAKLDQAKTKLDQARSKASKTTKDQGENQDHSSKQKESKQPDHKANKHNKSHKALEREQNQAKKHVDDQTKTLKKAQKQLDQSTDKLDKQKAHADQTKKQVDHQQHKVDQARREAEKAQRQAKEAQDQARSKLEKAAAKLPKQSPMPSNTASPQVNQQANAKADPAAGEPSTSDQTTADQKASDQAASDPRTADQAASDQTASDQPAADQSRDLADMSVEDLYKRQQQAESQLGTLFQQMRAKELAMIRDIGLGQARKWTDSPLPEREDLTKALRQTAKAKDAKRFEQRKAALKKAQAQSRSRVSLADQLVSSASNLTGEHSTMNLSRELARLHKLQTAASEEQGRYVDLSKLMAKADARSDQANQASQNGQGRETGPAGEGQAAHALGSAQSRGGQRANAGQGRFGGIPLPGLGALMPRQASGSAGSGTGAGSGPDQPAPGAKPSAGGGRYYAPPEQVKVDESSLAPARKVYNDLGRHAKWVFVDSWYTIGPFPNPGRKNIHRSFPPEQGVKLDSVYRTDAGKKLHWRFLQSPTPMVVPDNSAEYSIFYAYTKLKFDQPRDLWIAVGSDDRSDLWINANKVWASADKLKGWQIGEGYRKVHFKKGINHVLYRVENGWHQMGFSLVIQMPKT